MLVFNHSAHKELWNWLSENPDKEKADWPGWKHNGGQYYSRADCFCCDYARPITIPGDYYCPLCTSCNGTIGWCLDGLYYQWDEAEGAERAELARQIRDLPLRKDMNIEVI